MSAGLDEEELLEKAEFIMAAERLPKRRVARQPAKCQYRKKIFLRRG